MIEASRYIISIATALCAIVTASTLTAASASQRDFDALSGASYIYIATVRKDGNQSRAVPVWFIGKPDGEILIDTNSTSWKARRIRRGSPVLIWIGSRSGPAFIGKAEFVNDPAVRDFMIERIPKKYWLAWMGFFGPKRAKFDSGAVVTIRIMIESDLAAGFQSQPGTPAPATPDKTSASASRIQN
ncbi:MAG TPA: pyridoxamine 5'-phosphate oxidase family protein [Candidatus Binataceae bacterium]|nr:pyridoxamine 5'-phosphate oxidase family protein [Candidatus Binataceae bacterium]